jgi:hypothetical protein
MNLQPCPQCGSPARIDSTGTLECYGWAWQNLYIYCTDTRGQHCGMELNLHADFCNTNNAEQALVMAWNMLNKQQ